MTKLLTSCGGVGFFCMESRILSLCHKTIVENPSLCSLLLPISEALRAYHPCGNFPVVHDPDSRRKTTIIGMFVLRSAHENWTMSSSDSRFISSMYDVKNWAYNVDGIDGGWLISNKNDVDGYRLALQYGVSDAVIIGTKSVCAEGCDHYNTNPETGEKSLVSGYAWLPYVVASWPGLKQLDSNLADKIQDQRILWQQLGHLSPRKYPAQILITTSGEIYDGSRDFLEGRVLTMHHPEGDPVEVYIITSVIGADKIRSRASKYGLQSRIDSMLIVCSPIENPHDIDYSKLPEILYSQYNIKIANHDGGQAVLRRFCQEGIMSQFNFTLMRQVSLYSVIDSCTYLPPDTKETALQNFDTKTRIFFTGSDGCIPKALKIVSLLEDTNEELVVATFSAEQCTDI